MSKEEAISKGKYNAWLTVIGMGQQFFPEEIKESKIKNHRQLYLALTQEKNHDMLRKGEYGMTKTQIKNLERSGKIPVF